MNTQQALPSPDAQAAASVSRTPREIELEAVLTELLALYKWRFELAEMEKQNPVKHGMRRLLNQYGREKKFAWQRAEAVLKTGASPRPPAAKEFDEPEPGERCSYCGFVMVTPCEVPQYGPCQAAVERQTLERRSV